MKLRITGNSLRIRVTRSELARLVDDGRIADSIQFVPDKSASLTYALACSPEQKKLAVLYEPQQVTIAIPFADAEQWASSDQVGISFDLHGRGWILAVLIEKDFACLDGSDAENADTFPNPNQGAVC